MYKPTGRPIGRPPIYDTQTSERIYINVTPAQFLELQRIAHAQGVSKARIIREAVNRVCDDCGARRPFGKTR
jgi:hypothetical protein